MKILSPINIALAGGAVAYLCSVTVGLLVLMVLLLMLGAVEER